MESGLGFDAGSCKILFLSTIRHDWARFNTTPEVRHPKPKVLWRNRSFVAKRRCFDSMNRHLVGFPF